MKKPRNAAMNVPNRPWKAGTVGVGTAGHRYGLPHTFGFMRVTKGQQTDKEGCVVELWERPDGKLVVVPPGTYIGRTPDGVWEGLEPV